ncbi:MAG: MarR family winged helix-turn-helix transcriptional regulator [Acidimicrobiales bacterium]
MSSVPPETSSPQPDLDATVELAGQLRLSVTRLARVLRQTADTDLSPTQGSVLATVSSHGPLTLGELAERERVASPTITKVIGLLHEKGLVDKATDPDDRRFVRVALTPAGEDLLERTRARKNAWLARQLAQLTDDEQARLAAATEVLDRLTTQGTLR